MGEIMLLLNCNEVVIYCIVKRKKQSGYRSGVDQWVLGS
jgi:hypothetical protein